ncbi:hypothetical protein [Actinacidiphila epipremni]|uniref:Integral membrane protein n=1 Tax=Actinacidiphila epipremni TaxID=2053013 RepID=A0ABX0ZKH9_9ACTN|nr:hypothetical protein [Actinacidiphila epipremni]NJP43806.1 hypothetical protein [Actinacidiphila epipremni]
MTAAEHEENAGDDDALFVLTAAMLTPERFPGVLGDDYPAACARLELDPLPDGYGMMFGQDGRGARWTVVTTDTAMVACALAAWDCGLEYDLSPGEDTLAASLPGWPLPVAVSVPGIPAPHDPADEEAGAPLTPPDVSVWGPPQRRLGADEIAVRWHEWRGRLPASAAPEPQQETHAEAEPGAPEAAAPEAETGDAGPRPLSHPGVRRALAEAQGYVRTPPPPGRVRTTAGTLRADGPGWSLVARTDDIAFVLLDEAPGEVLPVGRGPSLPPLLEALGRLAAAAPS